MWPTAHISVREVQALKQNRKEVNVNGKKTHSYKTNIYKGRQGGCKDKNNSLSYGKFTRNKAIFASISMNLFGVICVLFCRLLSSRCAFMPVLMHTYAHLQLYQFNPCAYRFYKSSLLAFFVLRLQVVVMPYRVPSMYIHPNTCTCSTAGGVLLFILLS